MKCASCGREIKAPLNTKPLLCPLCRMPIDGNITAEDALRLIVAERGTDIFRSGDIIDAILADMLTDRDRERQRIRLALMAGAGDIVYRLLSVGNGTLGRYEMNELYYEMISAGFSESFAAQTAFCFGYALCQDTECFEFTQPKENGDVVRKETASEKSDKAAMILDRGLYNPQYHSGLSTVFYGCITIGKLQRGSAAYIITDIGEAICVDIKRMWAVDSGFSELCFASSTEGVVGLAVSGISKENACHAYAVVSERGLLHDSFSAKLFPAYEGAMLDPARLKRTDLEISFEGFSESAQIVLRNGQKTITANDPAVVTINVGLPLPVGSNSDFLLSEKTFNGKNKIAIGKVNSIIR